MSDTTSKAPGQIAYEAYWANPPAQPLVDDEFILMDEETRAAWAAAERAVAAPLIEVLTQIQWCIEDFDSEGGVDGTYYNHCPVCEEPQHLRHAHTCAIGILIARYKGDAA